MTERRRRDLLTPLLFALAVILLLAFWVFRPFLLVFAVAACVALLLAPVVGVVELAVAFRLGLLFDASLPAAGLVPFRPGARAWADGASAERWLAIPDGTTIAVAAGTFSNS